MNKLRKQDLIVLGLCVVFFVVIEILLDQEIIDPYWEANIILMMINIILAVSLNLINGYTGQFSIGHAGFLAVGAYVGAIFTVKLEYPFEVALIAGTIAAAFLGCLIGIPTLRLNWRLFGYCYFRLRRNYSYFHFKYRLCRWCIRFYGNSPHH